MPLPPIDGDVVIPKQDKGISKALLAVWIVDSAILAWLFPHIWLNGSTPDSTKMASDLSAVWGGTAAFLIWPLWKTVKQWSTRSKKILAVCVITALAAAGGLFWIRARQTAKLQTLFKETHDIGVKGAPQKQLFMKITRENPQTLDAYLQWCADLEPVLNEYESSERQMDDVLSQMQHEIDGLNPKASYAGMVPMLNVMQAVLAKDLEAAESYKHEIEYGKQLPGIPERDRIRFYNANIQPVVEQEHKIAQEEIAILKEAKARGVDLPENMLQDAGIK